MFESARSFWLNVFWAASMTARKRTKPGSWGSTRNSTLFAPASRSTRSTPTWTPLANSRTVAAWATVELTSAVTWIRSPRRDVDGVVSRSTITSSAPPRPMTWVSTWIPRAAARAASAWPWPVVSLPSERRTIRFWASSGKSAEASRRAEPMSVADRTGADAIRSISRSSAGSRSTSAPRPKATIPAASPSGMSARLSRTKASASSRPSSPTESDRSTTKTVARRSTGRTSRKPARANTSDVSSSVRTMRATRRRPVPVRRRAAA